MQFDKWSTLGGLGKVERGLLQARVTALEVQLAAAQSGGGLAMVAASKIGAGAPVSRAEAAAFLGVSTKMLQRMEAAGRLERCPSLGAVVRYAASDVRKLASARHWKED